jgi:hypothetical protein
MPPKFKVVDEDDDYDMPAAPKLTGNLGVKKHITEYVKTLADVAKEEAAFKSKIAPKKLLLEKLKGHLQRFLDETGQTSARTENGIVYFRTSPSARLADADIFIKFVMKTGEIELLDRRANARACLDYAEEHDGRLPPGVVVTKKRITIVKGTSDVGEE